MKLLVVTPYFYPKIGGLENYAYNFCIGLKNKYKWDIVVVTSNHTKKEDTRENLNGLTIYRLAPWFKLSNTPVNPFWYFKIKKIITEEKPNIINAHTPVPFIAEIAAISSQAIPFILTYHALSLYKQGLNPFNLIVWIYKLTENYLFHKANKIIVVSEYVKNKLPLNLQRKVTVINNSIREKEIPHIISASKKKNIIIFAGSLDKTHMWKGLDSILLSIREFTEKYSKDILLLVLGEGNWKNNYIRLAEKLQIEKYVSFLGQKTGREKNQYFRKAKLSIVYPKTSNDALPTFLLESWAYSLPVIGSHVQPISKIIKNNFSGLIIQPGSSEKLAKSIYTILTNSKLRQRLSKNGYQTVKKLYVFEDQLVKFNTLLINNI